jgi:hypothetical protein
MELVVETLSEDGNDVTEIVSYKISDEGQISIIDNAEHLEDEKQIFESRIYSAMENVKAMATESDRNPSFAEKNELYGLVEAKVSGSEK